MIIESDRWRDGDRERWERDERRDALRWRMGLERQIEQAKRALLDFFEHDQSGYVGVSWGKDSVTLAHLVAELGLDVPVVWVKIWPVFNPDCEHVRDAFLSEHDIDYHEIEVEWWPEQKEAWRQHAQRGSLEWSLGYSPKKSAATKGFGQAEDLFGARHVSGVRAAESDVRRIRMWRWGHSTDRTCAPIGWWSTEEVFAYLHGMRLPTHPAYAMTMGGARERESIRVDALGGGKGKDKRTQWEGLYYSDRLDMICREALR